MTRVLEAIAPAAEAQRLEAAIKDLTDKISKLEHTVSVSTANERLLKQLREFLTQGMVQSGPSDIE